MSLMAIITMANAFKIWFDMYQDVNDKQKIKTILACVTSKGFDASISCIISPRGNIFRFRKSSVFLNKTLSLIDKWQQKKVKKNGS